MDQTQAPVLDALSAYLANGQLGFTPPGHKQGRGTDPRVLEVLGSGPFRADVLATGGLDDRTASRGILCAGVGQGGRPGGPGDVPWRGHRGRLDVPGRADASPPSHAEEVP